MFLTQTLSPKESGGSKDAGCPFSPWKEGGEVEIVYTKLLWVMLPLIGS
jgi:hypothetical protein